MVNIATHLAANPGGTLPQAFADWAEVKAAYRFFDNPRVDFQKVVRPHVERTRRACREPGEYLIIEDSSNLDYSRHRRTQDLGVIGDGEGRGFELHTALAVRVEGWTLEQRPEGQVVGLFDQQCRRPHPAPRGESRAECLKRRRKSSWWAEAFQAGGASGQRLPLDLHRRPRIGFLRADPDLPRSAVDFIIRAGQDRRLAQEVGKLRAALAQAPVLGQSTVELRSRGGEPARTAIVELRSVPVDLDGPWRPGGWQEPLRGVTALEVCEVSAPEGVREPLHWILLTSLPCRTLTEARRLVGRVYGTMVGGRIS